MSSRLALELATTRLISPLEKYLLRGANKEESGSSLCDSSAMAKSAARAPESALQKSLK